MKPLLALAFIAVFAFGCAGVPAMSGGAGLGIRDNGNKTTITFGDGDYRDVDINVRHTGNNEQGADKSASGSVAAAVGPAAQTGATEASATLAPKANAAPTVEESPKEAPAAVAPVAPPVESPAPVVEPTEPAAPIGQPLPPVEPILDALPPVAAERRMIPRPEDPVPPQPAIGLDKAGDAQEDEP